MPTVPFAEQSVFVPAVTAGFETTNGNVEKTAEFECAVLMLRFRLRTTLTLPVHVDRMQHWLESGPRVRPVQLTFAFSLLLMRRWRPVT